MRRFFLCAAILATTMFTSCNSGPKPEAIAEEFLNAYLSTDYEKAASFCTPTLSQDLMKALEQAEALNEDIKEKIKKHTPNYRPQIDSLSHNKGKDTVKVYYSIINSISNIASLNTDGTATDDSATNSSTPDSSATSNQAVSATAAPKASTTTVSATQIISSALTVVKAEEGWKVNTLNN